MNTHTNQPFLADICYLLCVGVVAYVFLHYVQRPYQRLSHVPGPLVCKITNIWRYLDVRNGQHHQTMIDLHRRYGDYVRVGPNAVSTAQAEDIARIYGVNSEFRKDAFYDAFLNHKAGKVIPSLFREKDEDTHKRIKKPIAHAYTMTHMLNYEHIMDRVILKLLSQLEQRYVSKIESDQPTCDIGLWLQYLAFDMITEVTFSTSLGFLDHGEDISGFIRQNEATMDTAAPICHLPWLGYLHRKNPLNGLMSKDSNFLPSFVQGHVKARKAARKLGVQSQSQDRDFLDHFLDAQQNHPDVVDDALVSCYAVTNIGAGSDAVAIPVRTIIYHVLRDPRIYERLIAELRNAGHGPKVSFQAAQNLIYMDAIIKESLRLHPPVGLGLERIVPAPGIRLGSANSSFMPTGTQISVNAWVIHRNPEIFGDLTDEFVPERWLQAPGETSEDFDERLHRMIRSSFTFGHGPRTCIGKNLGLCELYKVVPAIFSAFEMEMADGSTWKTRNSWFVRQHGLVVKLRKISL